MRNNKKHFLILILLIFISVFFSLSFFNEPIIYGEENSESYLGENSIVREMGVTQVGNLPCIGNPKILVFYTDFKGGDLNWNRSLEETEDFFFSEYGKFDQALAYSDFDSLRSFYYRSSYGKVDITGDVIEYQTKEDTSFYPNVGTVLDEIIDEYKEKIDWQKYDTNNDGYIDGIYIVARYRHSFGGPNFVGAYSNEVGGLKISRACFIDSSDLATLAHETCHMFGPPDMYLNVGVNPSGLMATSIMDGGTGDIPSPTKFVLGWLDNVKFISRDEIGEYNLRSYSNYPDVLIIYPNGDKNNRSWFFVEYVTIDGNNKEINAIDGLRVFRAYMNVDDDYNVLEYTEHIGMLSSPYEYIECVHPDKVSNYHLMPGESLTPYTYPSTAYGKSFYNEGNVRYLNELTFSGINIDFLSVSDDTAKVSIDIESEPNLEKTCNGTISFLDINNSTMYLVDDEYVAFMVLESENEIVCPDGITISSSSLNVEYKVKGEVLKNNRTLFFKASIDTLKALKKADDWVISFDEIKTCYGGNVNITNEIDELSFKDVPIPYSNSGLSHLHGLNIAFSSNFELFDISESKVLGIFYNDSDLSLSCIEIDKFTNEFEVYDLTLPENFDSTGFDPYYLRVLYRDETYFVVLGKYVCAYKNNELVSYYVFSNSVSFLGDNNYFSFFDRQSFDYYHLSYENSVFSLELLDFSEYSIITLNNWNIKSILSYEENKYIISLSSYTILIDLEKGTYKYDLYEKGTNSLSPSSFMFFKDDYYYVFRSDEDLDLYIYDSDLNLIKSKCIFKNMYDTIWGPSDMTFTIEDNSYIISFSSVSHLNPISFSDSFLIKCDEDFNVINYFRYGDTKSRYSSKYIPISETELLYFSESRIGTICIECDNHDFADPETLIKASCSYTGISQRTCKTCGFKEITEIEKKEHVLSDWEILYVPTCASEGERFKYCINCYICLETETIEMIDHEKGNTAVIDEIPATCTEYGSYTEITYCKMCYNEISRETIIVVPTDHIVIEYTIIKDATCTNDGIEEGLCIYCNNTVSHIIPMLNHIISDEWTIDINPTCTSKGKKSHHCIYCDTKFDETEIDEAPHKGKDPIKENIVNATCINTGSCELVTYCEYCNNEIEREYITLDLIDHSYKETILIDATCTLKGSVQKECTYCKNTVTEEIDALGHSFSDEWTIDINPTCTKEGEKSHHCIRCSEKVDIVSIPLIDHVFNDLVIIKDATCTDDGEGVIECTECGLKEYQVIEAHGHKYESTWTIDIAPSCTKEGEKSHHCMYCSEVSNKTSISKTNHTFSEYTVTKDPTCTLKGEKERTCEVCTYKEIKTINPTGHKWDTNWTVDINPTCSEEGQKSHHCLNCSEVKDIKKIEVLSHTPSDIVIENEVKSSCAKKGSYEEVVYCIECTKEISRTLIESEMLPHEFNDWTITKNPTVIETGERERCCIHCGYQEKEVIEKIDSSSLFIEALESINPKEDSLEELYNKLSLCNYYYYLIDDKDEVSSYYQEYIKYLQDFNSLVDGINEEFKDAKTIENKFFIKLIEISNILSLLFVSLIKRRRWFL